MRACAQCGAEKAGRFRLAVSLVHVVAPRSPLHVAASLATRARVSRPVSRRAFPFSFVSRCPRARRVRAAENGGTSRLFAAAQRRSAGPHAPKSWQCPDAERRGRRVVGVSRGPARSARELTRARLRACVPSSQRSQITAAMMAFMTHPDSWTRVDAIMASEASVDTKVCARFDLRVRTPCQWRSLWPACALASALAWTFSSR